MLFGINSLSFTDTFLESDLPLMEKARDLGFDVFEITPVDPDRFPAAKVRARAADLGLQINGNFALPETANTWTIGKKSGLTMKRSLSFQNGISQTG